MIVGVSCPHRRTERGTDGGLWSRPAVGSYTHLIKHKGEECRDEREASNYIQTVTIWGLGFERASIIEVSVVSL